MTPVSVFFSAQIPIADFQRPLCQQLRSEPKFSDSSFRSDGESSSRSGERPSLRQISSRRTSNLLCLAVGACIKVSTQLPAHIRCWYSHFARTSSSSDNGVRPAASRILPQLRQPVRSVSRSGSGTSSRSGVRFRHSASLSSSLICSGSGGSTWSGWSSSHWSKVFAAIRT